MSNRNHEPKIKSLSERARFSKDATITVGSISLVLALGMNSCSDSRELPDRVIVCTTKLDAPNFESFATDMLGAETPAERQRLATEVARQSGLSDPSSVNAGRELNLTADQCATVDGNGGEVSYFEPAE